MWIKPAWYVAAFSNHVQHELLARTFLGEAVVMFRDAAGRPVVMADFNTANKGVRLNFMAVGGYDGMAVIYKALENTKVRAQAKRWLMQ